MVEYNINGYRVHSDYSVTLTHNETNISFSKALYLAKLWKPLCKRLR